MPAPALQRMGAELRGARLVRTLHATPLKTSYLLEQAGQRLVLRVDGPPARAMGLDRQAEFAIQQMAWRAGLAPEPIALYGGEPAMLLTRYAPGRAWRAGDLRQPARLRLLAAHLRRLHLIPAAGPTLDLEQSLAGYARRAGDRAARRVAGRASRLLARTGLGQGSLVLCHNDPIADNVVGFHRSMLIDWEYSGRGDPLFDLAVVIRHHRLPPRLAERFAVAYFGNRDQVPWNRLQGAGRVYDHVLNLWLRALAAQHKLSPAQLRLLAVTTREIM